MKRKTIGGGRTGEAHRDSEATALALKWASVPRFACSDAQQEEFMVAMAEVFGYPSGVLVTHRVTSEVRATIDGHVAGLLLLARQAATATETPFSVQIPTERRPVQRDR